MFRTNDQEGGLYDLPASERSSTNKRNKKIAAEAGNKHIERLLADNAAYMQADFAAERESKQKDFDTDVQGFSRYVTQYDMDEQLLNDQRAAQQGFEPSRTAQSVAARNGPVEQPGLLDQIGGWLNTKYETSPAPSHKVDSFNTEGSSFGRAARDNLYNDVQNNVQLR